MPHTKTHLIPLQNTVLAWIAAGSPDGVMNDAHHRITARGLSNGEFAVIEGKGATWKATITPLGIRVLAEHFPDLVNRGEVPVPKQLRNLHLIVAEYHQARSWHRVTADHSSRATRIL